MLSRSAVRFEVEATQDDTPIVGNASASGDDVADKATEEWIRGELESGNVWAWAVVSVTATVEGVALEGVAYMGGCSYTSEGDFKAPGGYYAQMCDEALADLERQIVEACSRITKPL